MIVDDSAVIRKVYRRIFENSADILIVAEASNGVEALESQRKNAVDIILLDADMPVMGGLEMLPRILLRDPLMPVIVATGLNKKNAPRIIKALEQGAAEIIQKPGHTSDNTVSGFVDQLIKEISILGRQKQIRSRLMEKETEIKLPDAGREEQRGHTYQAPSPDSPLSPASDFPRPEGNQEKSTSSQKGEMRLIGYRASNIRMPDLQASHKAGRPDVKPQIRPVYDERPDITLRPFPASPIKAFAIGASTGAINNYKHFLPELSGLGCPVFITQHIDAFFSNALANQFRLWDQFTVFEVDEPRPVLPKHIYIASGNQHMVAFQEGGEVFVRPDDAPAENFSKPSVNPMLRSLSVTYEQSLCAIILSGMGKDGLEGCEAVVAKGGGVIAQSELSSISWRMPRHVAEAGLCSALLAPEEIARWCQKRVGNEHKRI